MARLFTGIEIPASVAIQLDLLRGGIPGARWIDAASYHITVRFIGDVDNGLAGEITGALERVGGEAFSLELRGLGHFGGARPHSLHASVVDNPALTRLQAAHERVCRDLGLAPCPRRFSPHVTLARMKRARRADVERYKARHATFALAPFPVERLVLYSARPSRGGGPYGVEQTYPLRTARM